MTNDTAVQRMARYSTATLHEAAGKTGALPSAIKPVAPNFRLCGPAFTVSSPPMDNLMLHRAIAQANPGDVLVVTVSHHDEAGYWGDIMTTAAVHRGIAGLVIDGCVRDGEELERDGFPVFAKGLHIQGTSKHGGGYLNQPIALGGVVVHPGDIVVGDRDGVVVIEIGRVEAVLLNAEKRVEDERRIKEELGKGKSTLEIYGWQ